MLRWRRRAVGALVAVGVAVGGAGVWCCGGSGSVPPETPAEGTGEPAGGPSGVTAALVDPAVVGSGAAPAPSSHGTEGSGSKDCAAGAVWLTVRVVALGSGATERTVVLREGGAYTDETRSGATRGCLKESDRSTIQAALEAADFAPPPPPEMQCMAVPTREVTVEHPASGRSATFSSPCGKPVHPSIGELVRLVLGVGSNATSDAPR